MVLGETSQRWHYKTLLRGTAKTHGCSVCTPSFQTSTTACLTYSTASDKSCGEGLGTTEHWRPQNEASTFPGLNHRGLPHSQPPPQRPPPLPLSQASTSPSFPGLHHSFVSKLQGRWTSPLLPHFQAFATTFVTHRTVSNIPVSCGGLGRRLMLALNYHDDLPFIIITYPHCQVHAATRICERRERGVVDHE